MADSQRFKAATDWIKKNKGVTLGELAEHLDIERHQMDNYRRGQTQPDRALIKKLFSFYPESREAWDAAEVDDMVNEVGNEWLAKMIKTMEATIQSQEKLITTLEKQVKDLEKENKEIRQQIAKTFPQNG